MTMLHKEKNDDVRLTPHASDEESKNSAADGLYTPTDLADIGFEYQRDVGLPGEFPFTRGIYPSMYRGRLWTMRQYAGFGTAKETNRRFRYMLDHGLAGINVAFDPPTPHASASAHPSPLG